MHIVFQSLIDHQAYVTYSYIYFVLATSINAGIKMIIYHIFSPTPVNYMSCKKGQRQLIFSVNYKLTSPKAELGDNIDKLTSQNEDQASISTLV
jgi:hypothetical protein